MQSMMAERAAWVTPELFTMASGSEATGINPEQLKFINHTEGTKWWDLCTYLCDEQGDETSGES